MWFLQTPLLIGLLIAILAFLSYNRKVCFEAIQICFRFVTEALYWNPSVIIYSIILFYFAYSFPLSYDEAFTFKHFTTKSFINILTNYPQPNNHLLHSLLTWVCWKLLHVIPGPEIVRIPSLMASLLSFQLVQHHLLKRSTFYSGILLVLVIITTNYFQFSFLARGYAMQSFFALLAYLIIRSSGVAFNVRYASFIALCFLGLFTNPAFIFSAVSLGVFWFGYEFNLFKKHINTVFLFTLCFALLTFLVYTPIMRHEGANALLGNEYVLSKGPVGIYDVLVYCTQLISFTFIPFPFSAIIPLAFIFFAVKTKEYSLLLIIIAPLGLMYGLNQLPHYMRILLPLTATISFITLHNLAVYYPSSTINVFFKKTLPIIGSLAIFVGLYYFIYAHGHDDFNTALHVRTINERVKNAHHVYTHHIYWHLREPIEAQKVYAKNNWISIRTVPDSLQATDFLISSLTLPQFECTDTFNLHKGVAYLYHGK